jgi:hypothetical protein
MVATVDRLAAALKDRYRVERELGAGGMATVYLAEDLKHHRQVALKVLRDDLTASLGKERFLREISIAAGLTHPHILPLHDSGEADGHLFYVMPYVDGPTLRQRLLRTGELPIPDAVRILRDIADAMAHAHKRGVVHRDLKPENVMLTDRHALVTDFGVAKALSEATGRNTLTTAGVALGTPAYMSPEQATADPHTDQRSDIYSFGVLAYELLTGRTPFSGGSPQEVLAAHVTAPAVPVTSHRASIPPALAALVMKCLEKKPADRWQSADELIPQLEALLTPSGGITPHETAPYAAGSPAKPGWSRVASRAAIAVGALMVATLGYYGWRGYRATAGARSTNRIAVAWFENQTGDSTLADVGALAAEWIVDGLTKQSVGEVVPSTYVRELMAGELKGSRSPARELARRTAAQLLVTGTYTRRGDTLEFRGEILDSAGSHLLGRIGPVRGLRMETAALDSMFQQVAVALDSRKVWGDGSMNWPRPTNLAAWREYQTGGLEHFVQSDNAGSIPFYVRAISLDSTWASPYGMMSGALANLGRLPEADSVIAVARRVVKNPPPVIVNFWAWLEASHRGDYEAMYRAGKKGLELDPRQVYDAALPAARTGRFREVLALATRRDTNFWDTEWRGWDGIILESHHMLGQHEKELSHARGNIARRGLDLRTALQEVRPLAALGRANEVDSLYAKVKDMPPAGGNSPAGLLANAGWEFLAHRKDEALARRMFQQRLDYFNAFPAGERASFAASIAQSELMLGRLAESRALFDSLSRAAPNDVALLGQLGATAAMQGDTAAARAADARLVALTIPYLRGFNTLWRSRIAALSGNCASAAMLLRKALGEGQAYADYTHHWWGALGKARACRELPDVLKPRD